MSDGVKQTFRIKRNVNLGRMLRVFAKNMGKVYEEIRQVAFRFHMVLRLIRLRFVFGGARVFDGDTADTLDIESEDVIDGMLQREYAAPCKGAFSLMEQQRSAVTGQPNREQAKVRGDRVSNVDSVGR